jgi:thioredoxin-related protein
MLKKIPFFILLFTIFSHLYAIELDWINDYAKALKIAKKEHKDVYVFVGADECRFCDRFKKTTLQDKQLIKDLKKDYVPVYLSRDRHKIPAKFKTKGVPRHYFVTSDNKVFYNTWGSREVDGFYSVLDDAELSRSDVK